jgi:hypothetical protein
MNMRIRLRSSGCCTDDPGIINHTSASTIHAAK